MREGTGTRRRRPRILFRVAAGPRIGSGHLVRALRLAAAAAVPAHLSVRGDRADLLRVGPAIGCAPGDRADVVMRRIAPTLLVVDDPSDRECRAWIAEARRRVCPSVGVVDFGIGAAAPDVQIDGSVAGPAGARAASRVLSGPRFAVTDPAIAVSRPPARPPAGDGCVFISLGGGYRVAYARQLARRLRQDGCTAPIVVAGGFTGAHHDVQDGVQWLGPQPTLVPWLASARLAIVAGGITLYEACALGVPTVAVALVAAQRRPVAAMARLGAVVPALGRSAPPEVVIVVRRTLGLLARPAECRRLSARGRAVVDGRGAARVGILLRRLAAGERVDSALERVRAGEGDRRRERTR